MKSFGIVVIGYKKLEGIKRLLSSLEKVDYQERNDITLILSIDFAQDNNDVRGFVEDYNWQHGEKSTIIYSENQGLKKHIISCGDLTNEFDILVVLEDDLYLSNSLYHYAHSAASYYFDDDNIAGISLYNFDKNWLNTLHPFNPQNSEFDVYFLKIAQSWGQVWTKNKWSKFKEWYSKNPEFIASEKLPKPLNDWSSKSSWLKYHDRYCIEENKYFVYPYISISTNFSDPGTHSKTFSNDSQSRLLTNKTSFNFPEFSRSAVIYDEFMEREGLEEIIGVPEGTLTVDIYGNKPKVLFKEFLLTTRNYNYEIINEYLLCFKPIEYSIIQHIRGNGIILYNTNNIKTNKYKNDKYRLLRYSLGVSSYQKYKILLFFSIRGIISSIKDKFF